MDELILNEIYIEMVCIQSKFRKCFKKDNATFEGKDNLIHDALKSYGYIIIDHDQIEECMRLLNDNFEKARKIKNINIRKILMKCLYCYAAPLSYYYAKGQIMDVAGCGELLYTNLTSIDNICYFIENKLINHRDVQLVFLAEKNMNNSMHLILYNNPITTMEDNYMIGYVWLVGENGKISFVLDSNMHFDKQYNIKVSLPYELQTIYVDEIYNDVRTVIDTQMWDDSCYDLRGV